MAADGKPADIVTPALLADVLGVEGRVAPDERGGWPVCYPDHPLEVASRLRNENHIH